MNSRFAPFRNSRAFVLVLLVAFLCFPPFPLSARDAKPTRTVWEKKLAEEILAVVNADSSRMKLQGPNDEDVLALTGVQSDFGQSAFSLLGNSYGVLLLAARDKSQFVQLIALDVSTGDKLWQLPCTGLPLSGLSKFKESRTYQIVSSFMIGRNQIITVQQADARNPAGAKVLVSYDLRTGAELWQAGAQQIDYEQMVTQMTKGVSGWIARRAIKAVNLNAITPPMASYSMLPQKGMLLKSWTDQSGVGYEMVDLDTGKSLWANPGRLAFEQLKRTQSIQDQKFSAKAGEAQPMLNWIRGDYLIMPCAGDLPAEVGSAGGCHNIRAYNLATGVPVWDFHENTQAVMGWVPAQELVLVHYPQKIVAVKLATGDKVYEIVDGRVSNFTGAFTGKIYARDARLFWFDRSRGDNLLTAMEPANGKILWQTPTSRSKVLNFIVGEKSLVVGTEREVLLLDKGSGEVILRQKPLGGAEIRAVATLDSHSIAVVGDKEIARYETEPWKEVYRVAMPEPKRSIWGDIALIGLAATMAALEVYSPGYAPGYAMGGFVGRFETALAIRLLLGPTGSLLSDQTNALIQKLERQSSNYCYFMAGDVILRADVAGGKLEEVSPQPPKDAILAFDESHGIGCLIRNRSISAFQMPVDEHARQTTRYLNALELGSREMRRGTKLEANDEAKAAYKAALGKLGEALSAAGEIREKAVVNLALGNTCDRLSVLFPAESESWQAKAGSEYRAAANLACAGDTKDLRELCRTATELASEAKGRTE